MKAIFRPNASKVGPDFFPRIKRRGHLIIVGDPPALPLPADWPAELLFDGASLAAIRAAHGITSTLPAPVPATITPAQIRLQLIADGKSDADVMAVIAHLSDPVKTQATILWEYALEFHRAHPLVNALASALGYDTPEKLDAFFRAAGAR